MEQREYVKGYEARLRGVAAGQAVGPVATEGLGSGVLAAALGAGRELVRVLAAEHVADQRAVAEETVLRTARRFEQWKAQYMEVNQGRLALNAHEDFARAYEEIAREETEAAGIGEHEVEAGNLRRRLAQQGIFAVRDGLGWRERQRGLWRESLLRQEAEELLQYAGDNPEDAGGIARRRAELEAMYRRAHPGLAGGMPEIDDAVTLRRAATLAARGDVAGLDAMGGSLSQRLLAGNNPGSVKLDADSFAAYASLEDGYKAVMGRLARYHNAPERGWRAGSIRELIGIYAPPVENDTRNYVDFVSQHTGIDADARLDFADPATYAGITSAILQMEHGHKVAAADLMGPARDFLAHGAPKPVGRIAKSVRPEVAARIASLRDNASRRAWLNEAYSLVDQLTSQADLEAEISKMDPEKAQHLGPIARQQMSRKLALAEANRAAEDMRAVADLMAGFADADDTTRQLVLMDYAQSIDDPERRQRILNLGQSQIKFDAEHAAVRNIADADAFLAEQTGQPAYKILAALDKADLSEGAKEAVRNQLAGPASKVTAQNQDSLNDALFLVDSGALQTQAERTRYALDYNLTVAQRRRLLEYQGNLAEVPISRVNSALKALNLGEKTDADLYDQVLNLLPKGRHIFDTDIQNVLAAIHAKGDNAFLFFSSDNLGDAISNGHVDDWLPKLESGEKPQLTLLLNSHGIKATTRNMQTLKKLNILKSIGQTTTNIQWE